MKAGAAPLWLVCVGALTAGTSAALAQTDDEMNAANNPLQPTLSINLHTSYVDSYYGLRDAGSNSGLLRGALPHKLFGKPQLLRATLPIVPAQPLVIFNLPKAWYLRSTATWDLHEGTCYLPIGAGAGKVWKHSAATWNVFVEPQWTVAHDGDGVPKFQIYASLNLQFPL